MSSEGSPHSLDCTIDVSRPGNARKEGFSDQNTLKYTSNIYVYTYTFIKDFNTLKVAKIQCMHFSNQVLTATIEPPIL